MTPSARLAEHAFNPMPSGARLHRLETADGIVLRAASWPARDPDACRGTICLFQGRAEQIEKYFETIDDLLGRGFAVATLDWRGQGGSARLLADPRKGHVRRFADYERDLAVFREGVVEPLCPRPWFVLAHSMGGNVLLGHAARDGGDWITRMVLTAPFLEFGRTPMSRANVGRLAATLTMLGMAGRYIPGPARDLAVVRAFEGNPLTHDPVRFARMTTFCEAEPDLTIDAPTIGWIQAALGTIAAFEARGFADRLKVPTLFVGSGADTLVSTAAIERMASRVKNAGYVFVPGARHEIMMESDRYRRQFLAAFDAFVPGSAG